LAEVYASALSLAAAMLSVTNRPISTVIEGLYLLAVTSHSAIMGVQNAQLQKIAMTILGFVSLKASVHVPVILIVRQINIAASPPVRVSAL